MSLGFMARHVGAWLGLGLAVASSSDGGLSPAVPDTSTVAYPRPYPPGERLLEWLRANGGQAHARVLEVSPGHRILVTDRDIAPPDDEDDTGDGGSSDAALIVHVPTALSLHPASAAVLALPLVQDHRKLSSKKKKDKKKGETGTNYYGDGAKPDEDDLWGLTTFLMWGSQQPAGSNGTSEGVQAARPYDAYFAALPSPQDYEDACDWSLANYAELQMQPYEAGVMQPAFLTRGPAMPTASWPGRTYDLDDGWEAWRARATAVQAANGWFSKAKKKKPPKKGQAAAADQEGDQEGAVKAALLGRWGVGEGFFEDRKLWAWADHLMRTREWEEHQLFPVLDMADSSLAPRHAVSVLRESGGTIKGAARRGDELFTFPGQLPNVGFLRSSCYVFEANPFDFVALDVLLTFGDHTPAQAGASKKDKGKGSSSSSSSSSNSNSAVGGFGSGHKAAAAVVAALQGDPRPFKKPHPMDQSRRVSFYGESSTATRAVVRLLPGGDVEALLSLARAVAFPGTAAEFVAAGRGRRPLPRAPPPQRAAASAAATGGSSGSSAAAALSEVQRAALALVDGAEATALGLALAWLSDRWAAFPTSTTFDEGLLSDLNAARASAATSMASGAGTAAVEGRGNAAEPRAPEKGPLAPPDVTEGRKRFEDGERLVTTVTAALRSSGVPSNVPSTAVARERLRTAVVFRLQQKEIVRSSLSAVRALIKKGEDKAKKEVSAAKRKTEKEAAAAAKDMAEKEAATAAKDKAEKEIVKAENEAEKGAAQANKAAKERRKQRKRRQDDARFSDL